jgi:NAD(P)-dependent dehydrogenase (short-subunit alcohol dehydrogenase family)
LTGLVTTVIVLVMDDGREREYSLRFANREETDVAYTGKVALITGGGSGMGQLAARQFAEAGAAVAILDVNEAGMAETASTGGNIQCHAVDITDYAAVAAIVGEIETSLGAIDRVYNCAAIMPFGKLMEQDPSVTMRLMNINYGGLVSVARATVPGMVARGAGDFVSFASMAGIIPSLMMGGYNASKAAVATYTEVLKHEHLNSGVNFACVCPPAVATPLLQQGKDTTWPKLMQQSEGKEILPEQVLAAIEVGLAKGDFWIPVTREAKIGMLMRRLLPGSVWKSIHKIEGW